MVYATMRYHALVRYNREETYKSQKRGRWAETLTLALLYLFVFGFCVGLVDALLREARSTYTFVAGIFFFGAVFVFSAVTVQTAMARRLRDKNLELMRTLVNAIEMKDTYTRGHSEHVYRIVELLYDHLDDDSKERLSKPKLLDAAMLHDCGKISIRDDVLNKTGGLSTEDWASIKSHPLTGKKLLDDTCYCDISEWVLYHHERMDGNGYFGLKGEDIPLESRVIAVADTYSALITDRVYRERMPHERAARIVREASGNQLDPLVVESFLKIGKRRFERLLPQRIPKSVPVNKVAETSHHAGHHIRKAS